MLLMQDRPRGLFGGGRGRKPVFGFGEELPPMPGPISGFGGGTWNIDGSVATLPDAMRPTPDEASGATAIGWNPDDASLPRLPVKPKGIFGTQPLPPLLPDSRNGEPMGATAMGSLPAHGQETLPAGGLAGLPRRGSFDYDAAMASLLPQKKKRSTLDKIATVALPALMALGGNQAGANAFIQMQWAKRNERQRREAEAAETIAKWKHDDWARQHGADLRASAPRVIGRSMVQYDPNAGQVNELYDGPEDYEEYAEAMGVEPGSEEYFRMVEDFVLKSDGPSAYERDTDLDDHRTGNRLKIEGVRQGNRVGLEGIRQRNRVTIKGTPTYRDTHPRPTASARGGAGSPVRVSTPAEANALKPGTVYRTPDGQVRVR